MEGHLDYCIETKAQFQKHNIASRGAGEITILYFLYNIH